MNPSAGAALNRLATNLKSYGSLRTSNKSVAAQNAPYFIDPRLRPAVAHNKLPRIGAHDDQAGTATAVEES